ncbi:hypothetical protein CBER1_06682 [Cercospora berteroae]|uniref:BTB domain-containing protein n=1 Tax=Cercospora berteroae TaxID=357750 RepID=A0A2S6CFU2_9PEZI|nr:hypothetical protein CBER1_06682 [Cercospora berteroae]
MTETDERAPKRKRYNSRIITLQVGKEPETITIHEDNLRQSSQFFRAALDRHWREGTSGEIRLPEDHVEIVSAYVDWLYRGTCMEDCLNEDGDYVCEMWQTLAKMYVFGEKIQDARFSNVVLARMLDYIDKSGSSPGELAIRTVYEGTTVHSPVRQLLVAIWAAKAKGEWFKSIEEYPEEFLMDLAMKLVRLRGKAKYPPWTEHKNTWMKPE